MVRFEVLRQYNQVVDGIRFTIPQSHEEPYVIVYFSENSSFVEDYPKLNSRVMDLKVTVIPLTKIPRTKLTPELSKTIKSLGLYPIQSNLTIPKRRNLYYDISQYLNAVDDVYTPSNYRQRAGIFVANSINEAFADFPDYKKVLMYSVDVSKPLDQFVDRKVFPIIQHIKDGNFSFDHFVLVAITPSGSKYRLLIKDKNFDFGKLITFVRTIKTISTQEEIEDDANKASEEVLSNISDKIPEENKTKVKNAIKNYLKKDEEELDKVVNKDATKDDMNTIASTSIIYSTTGNLNKSKNAVKNASKNNKSEKILKTVDKNFTDQMLEKQKPEVTSDDQIVKTADVSKAVDNISPAHLFQKRQIDFKINLKNDLNNSFKVLEKKEIPLRIETIAIVDKPQNKSELDKSDISTIKVKLRDDFGNKHTLNIDIPKIDPESGTFSLNGRRKCLINQIILCPITFPKKYDSKFESSYSKFHLQSKRTKRDKFLEVYIASHWLPLFVMLSYSFGFENTMKKYGIEYQIVSKRPKKDEIYTRISEDNYILFSNLNTELKQELIRSITRLDIYSYGIKKDFGTKEYFNDLIIKITGRVNSTFLVTSNLENIVDPVARQILINQHLPSDLEDIMFYMASKVIDNFVQDRNDLGNQRIRGSEVIVHLVQKQILASYTKYKEQVLSGNKNAKFEINQTHVLSQFVQSEIVTDMEYANPVEEMSVMTRISPVGKSIGGIPDKESIQTKARNVHPSYFGNIDPLDTPEGENIGIVQQLSVDAMITSARGLFKSKPLSDNEGSGMLSTSCSMIPFIENNDGARIIMAANQARQMLPLKNPEPPVIKSGYEGILTGVLSNNFIKKAPCYSKILKVTNDSILIVCKDGSKKQIDLTPVHLRSGTGRDTLSIFIPKVKEGQVVQQGQILAEGSCVQGGEISLGRTLCCALMPYKGFNFEDGIVINERLVRDDLLTSLHGIEEEVLVSEKDRILYMVNIGAQTKKGEQLIRRTSGEIEELIGYGEEDETIEMSAGQLIKKSPGGKVVDIDVFSNVDDSKFPALKEFAERTRKRYGVLKDDKFSVRGRTIKGILIKFKIEQELKIGAGDKLCNRFGNKGIVSLVEKDSNMPRTPWGDTLDIILNPVGVLGRMNMGQVYELYTGLISKALAIRISNMKNRSQIIGLLKSVLPKIDNTKNQEYSSKLITSLSKLNERQFINLVNQIRDRKFCPLVIPPFKAPKPDQIREAMKVLDLKSGYNLYLPEYNTKTANEVPVGYMYISKLEHIGEMKIHVRSTGPVTSKTMQPTAGKSREGGQRLGEADTYCLISYNCPTILAEMFGPLSDDATTKNEIISDIIQNGNAEYRDAKVSPVKDLLNSYFIAMMLERE